MRARSLRRMVSNLRLELRQEETLHDRVYELLMGAFRALEDVPAGDDQRATAVMCSAVHAALHTLVERRSQNIEPLLSLERINKQRLWCLVENLQTELREEEDMHDSAYGILMASLDKIELSENTRQASTVLYNSIHYALNAFVGRVAKHAADWVLQ